MGGLSKDIVIKGCGQTDHEIAASLANFESRKAVCSVEGDRQVLRLVIESAFGTFGPFDSHVRTVLSQKLDEARANV
jgi:hypothetical protein